MPTSVGLFATRCCKVSTFHPRAAHCSSSCRTRRWIRPSMPPSERRDVARVLIASTRRSASARFIEGGGELASVQPRRRRSVHSSRIRARWRDVRRSNRVVHASTSSSSDSVRSTVLSSSSCRVRPSSPSTERSSASIRRRRSMARCTRPWCASRLCRVAAGSWRTRACQASVSKPSNSHASSIVCAWAVACPQLACNAST